MGDNSLKDFQHMVDKVPSNERLLVIAHKIVTAVLAAAPDADSTDEPGTPPVLSHHLDTVLSRILSTHCDASAAAKVCIEELADLLQHLENPTERRNAIYHHFIGSMPTMSKYVLGNFIQAAGLDGRQELSDFFIDQELLTSDEFTMDKTDNPTIFGLDTSTTRHVYTELYNLVTIGILLVHLGDAPLETTPLPRAARSRAARQAPAARQVSQSVPAKDEESATLAAINALAETLQATLAALAGPARLPLTPATPPGTRLPKATPSSRNRDLHPRHVEWEAPSDLVDLAHDEDFAFSDQERHRFASTNRAALQAGLKAFPAGESLFYDPSPIPSTFSFASIKQMARSPPSDAARDSTFISGPHMKPAISTTVTTFNLIEETEASMDIILNLVYTSLPGVTKTPMGVILFDVCGIPHHYGRLHQFSGKYADYGHRQIQCTIFNPDSHIDLAGLGLSYTSCYLLPFSPYFFNPFIEGEVQKANKPSFMEWEDAPGPADRTRILFEYKKQFVRLARSIGLIIEGHVRVDDPHHISKWAILVVFHLNRWVRATTRQVLSLLIRDIARDFDLHYKYATTNTQYLETIFPHALKLLDYTCPKGHPGGCALACPSCTVEVASVSSRPDRNTPEYKTAYANWVEDYGKNYKTQHGKPHDRKETTRAAFEAATLTSPTSRASNPRSYSIDSLKSRQDLIRPHDLFASI